MIPDEVIDRVREAADVVEIIGEHVKLRRMGVSHRGPCPFHGGKNPNFSVNPRTGSYHCFKCGESGDVFSFVQKRLGLDFVESVKHVGARSGVEVVEVRAQREERDAREPVWEINAAAAEFFQRALWDDEASGIAREYLESRALSREVADRFGVGFAPWDGERLRAHLAALGYTDAAMLEAGLLVRREGDGGEVVVRPRFRGRLMFPIHDAQGRSVAFGGRVVGKGEPKYLNSPESPVFVKGQTLYNLHRAKGAIRRDERALVVEGYVDAVRLAAAGVEAVVAPLGTALTDDQAEMLARLTKTVFLLYDSDQAGLKATFRAGDALLRRGVAVQVVTLPEGEDPDSYVRRHGAAGLERGLSAAIDVFERKVQILQRGGWFADLHRRRKALDRLVPTIRATSDPLTRDLYLARAAEAAGVSRDLLAEEVRSEPSPSRAGVAPPRPARAEPPSAGGPPAWDGPPPDAPESGGRRRERRSSAILADEANERRLLQALLQHRNFVEGVAERVDADSFRTPALRSVYAALVAAGADAGIDEVATGLGTAEVRVLNELTSDAVPEDIAATDVDAGLAWFTSRVLRDRLAAIDREPFDELPDDVNQRLHDEKRRILAELNAMRKPSWKKFSRRPDTFDS